MQIPGLMVEDSLDSLPWRATRVDGVEWIDLAPDGGARAAAEAPAPMTVLIRMAPGVGYPGHRHVGAEDVLILRGGYADDDGQVHRVGSYVRYPAGSVHHPTALGRADRPISEDNPPCVLYAVAHGGTEPVSARGATAQ
jgi:anti-sigma factor ChrR (cupin superfamily)